MPAHLVPREVVVMQDLPKNSAGKVIKRQLKAL
jgi:acyl-coenzyme A synthetase/AMP-(fatty) acid ligase